MATPRNTSQVQNALLWSLSWELLRSGTRFRLSGVRGEIWNDLADTDLTSILSQKADKEIHRPALFLPCLPCHSAAALSQFLPHMAFPIRKKTRSADKSPHVQGEEGCSALTVHWERKRKSDAWPLMADRKETKAISAPAVLSPHQEHWQVGRISVYLETSGNLSLQLYRPLLWCVDAQANLVFKPQFDSAFK